MKNRFATAFGIGLAFVGIVVAGILFMQRNARVGLTGNVLKVRTAPLDENSSVVVVDFRLNNPGNVLFAVRSVTVTLEEKNGAQFEGRTISEVDAKRLFEGLPLLGQKFTDTLVERDRIRGHTSQDRMVAARFDAPDSRLDARQRFLVRIEEVDGQISEFSEK